MNFRDCILGKIKDGSLSKQKGDQLLEKHDALARKYFMNGRSEEAADLAAKELLDTEQRLLEQKQRNTIQAALKQQEMNADYEAKLKESGQDEASFAPKFFQDVWQRAAYRSEQVMAEATQLMNKVADHINPNFLMLKRDPTIFTQGIRAALGEAVESPEARQVGEVIKQVFDYLHDRHRAAGGIMGKIEKYFPQTHKKEAISKVTEAEWVDYIYKRLDHDNMIDESTGVRFTEEKLRSILAKEYQSIVTAGRSEAKLKSRKGEMPKRRGGGDLDTKRDKSRFLHFKNADAFLEYNARFGVGDDGLISAFLGTVHSMSRDIGTLELLGPKPKSIAAFADWKMEVAGAKNWKRNWVNSQFRVLTSRFQPGDIDSAVWRLFTGTQNWLRSAMLGSASVSAISDTVFISTTAKVKGLGAVRVMGRYAELLAPGDREAKAIAKRANFLSDIVNGAALSDSRFATEHMDRGFTQILAGLTNKLSGLAHMTEAAKTAISLEAMATIAEQISFKKAWVDLDSDFRAGLAKFGLNEQDWVDLAKAQIVDSGEAKFLITSELRVDAGFDPLRAKELADKLDDWIQDLRQMASNESTLATRALTTGAIVGDGSPATLSRALMSSLLMFKSFPITVIMTHLLPAIQRANVQRKYDHIAMVMIGTTVLGAAAMQMKELIKGKTMKEMDDHKFWMAAAAQGGGLGLFGDFILGDFSRFGRTPWTEITGPMGGLTEDLWVATKGNLDRGFDPDQEANPVRDLFRVAKRNIPLASLWYGRLAVERLIMDNVERWVDPQYDRRLRRLTRKMNKETGQAFWWAPGKGIEEADPTLIAGEN